MLAIMSSVPGHLPWQSATGERSPFERKVIDGGTLRTLYLDLLGRPPYQQERGRWIGKTGGDFVDDVLGQEEFWRNWLEEQLYYFLLIENFHPTSEWVQGILSEIVRGGLGIHEVLHRICISSNFDRRNPGPDTFVTVVMEQVLGLTVQKTPRELDIGKRLYDGSKGTFLGKAGNSQADVVNIAIADDRAVPHFLRREHERLLRKAPDERKLTSWKAALDRDDRALGPVLREWFVSPDYEERLRTRLKEPNRLFVRSLYVDLLGRLPGEAEAQRVSNALDGLAEAAPLRSLMARLILDSGQASVPERNAIPDPERWILELFERLLGRPPQPDELAAFLAAFQDKACRPATVLYAIVSHPQYQMW